MYVEVPSLAWLVLSSFLFDRDCSCGGRFICLSTITKKHHLMQLLLQRLLRLLQGATTCLVLPTSTVILLPLPLPQILQLHLPLPLCTIWICRLLLFIIYPLSAQWSEWSQMTFIHCNYLTVEFPTDVIYCVQALHLNKID
jgi:hypothetical protein